MQIHEATYYRKAVISGGSSVLVSLRFGSKSDAEIRIVYKFLQGQECVEPGFAVEKYVSEAKAGVEIANIEFSGNLEIEEIELVPSDSPQPGQVKSASFEIAKFVLQK